MALSQKRQCIQPTSGHVFQILSLFNQTHQSQANFLSCTVAGQKSHLRADVLKEICIFLLSISIKVIIITHCCNLNREKMHHILSKGCVQTHQGMRMSDYTRCGKVKQNTQGPSVAEG